MLSLALIFFASCSHPARKDTQTQTSIEYYKMAVTAYENYEYIQARELVKIALQHDKNNQKAQALSVKLDRFLKDLKEYDGSRQMTINQRERIFGKQ